MFNSVQDLLAKKSKHSNAPNNSVLSDLFMLKPPFKTERTLNVNLGNAPVSHAKFFEAYWPVETRRRLNTLLACQDFFESFFDRLIDEILGFLEFDSASAPDELRHASREHIEFYKKTCVEYLRDKHLNALFRFREAFLLNLGFSLQDQFDNLINARFDRFDFEDLAQVLGESADLDLARLEREHLETCRDRVGDLNSEVGLTPDCAGYRRMLDALNRRFRHNVDRRVEETYLASFRRKIEESGALEHFFDHLSELLSPIRGSKFPVERLQQSILLDLLGALANACPAEDDPLRVLKQCSWVVRRILDSHETSTGLSSEVDRQLQLLFQKQRSRADFHSFLADRKRLFNFEAHVSSLDVRCLLRVLTQVFAAVVLPNLLASLDDDDLDRESLRREYLVHVARRRTQFVQSLRNSFGQIKLDNFLRFVFYLIRMHFEKHVLPCPDSDVQCSQHVNLYELEHCGLKITKERACHFLESGFEQVFFVHDCHDEDERLVFYEWFDLFRHCEKYLVTRKASVSPREHFLGLVKSSLRGFSRSAPFWKKPGGLYEARRGYSVADSFGRTIQDCQFEGRAFFCDFESYQLRTPKLSSFVCFSFGSEFMLSFLELCAKSSSELFVKDVIILGGTVPLARVLANLDVLLTEVVLGKVILVRSARDSLLKRFPSGRPVGLSEFDYCAAANRMMEQSPKFCKLGSDQTVEFLRRKVVCVDVSSTVKSYRDYYQKSGLVLQQISAFI